MKTTIQSILLVGIIAVTVICLTPTPVKQPKTSPNPKQKDIKYTIPKYKKKKRIISEPIAVLDHLLIEDN